LYENRNGDRLRLEKDEVNIREERRPYQLHLATLGDL